MNRVPTVFKKSRAGRRADRANALIAFVAGFSLLAGAAILAATAASAAQPDALQSALSQTVDAAGSVGGEGAAGAHGRLVLSRGHAHITEVKAWPDPSHASLGGIERGIILFGLINVFIVLFVVTAGEWKGLARRFGLGSER